MKAFLLKTTVALLPYLMISVPSPGLDALMNSDNNCPPWEPYLRSHKVRHKPFRRLTGLAAGQTRWDHTQSSRLRFAQRYLRGFDRPIRMTG